MPRGRVGRWEALSLEAAIEAVVDGASYKAARRAGWRLPASTIQYYVVSDGPCSLVDLLVGAGLARTCERRGLPSDLRRFMPAYPVPMLSSCRQTPPAQ